MRYGAYLLRMSHLPVLLASQSSLRFLHLCHGGRRGVIPETAPTISQMLMQQGGLAWAALYVNAGAGQPDGGFDAR